MRRSVNYLLLAGLLLLLPGMAVTTTAQEWRNICSVEDVCRAYPAEMKRMLEAFNLDYPGLERVKEAVVSQDLTEACKQLLAYYSSCSNAPHLRKEMPTASGRTVAAADTILENIFVIQHVRGKVPLTADGHRDWHYKGPNNDREWAWLSNRHSQLNQVFESYLETGNPKYAIYVDEFLRDFIIKSLPYPGEKGDGSVWRGLEVSFRSKVWSRIFYGMLKFSATISFDCPLLQDCNMVSAVHKNRVMNVLAFIFLVLLNFNFGIISSLLNGNSTIQIQVKNGLPTPPLDLVPGTYRLLRADIRRTADLKITAIWSVTSKFSLSPRVYLNSPVKTSNPLFSGTT
jgi:hypothetical protein